MFLLLLLLLLECLSNQSVSKSRMNSELIEINNLLFLDQENNNVQCTDSTVEARESYYVIFLQILCNCYSLPVASSRKVPLNSILVVNKSCMHNNCY